MDIGANISERRIGIRVGNIFPREYWNIAVCSVYVFLYTTNPIEWEKLVKVSMNDATHGSTNLFCSSVLSTILLDLRSGVPQPSSPTMLP